MASRSLFRGLLTEDLTEDERGLVAEAVLVAKRANGETASPSVHVPMVTRRSLVWRPVPQPGPPPLPDSLLYVVAEAGSPDNEDVDLFVGFPGARTNEQVIFTNLNASAHFEHNYDGGEGITHRGFRNALTTLQTAFSQTVSLTLVLMFLLATNKYRRVIFCGHGLGGALACLQTVDLLRVLNLDQHHRVLCITFGNTKQRETTGWVKIDRNRQKF